MISCDLSGKIALVTGASSGLGADFARVLSSAGAEVILAARRQSSCDALADEIRATGGHCRGLRMDVRDWTQDADTVAAIESVHILVNNAGLAREAPAMNASSEDWDDVIDTNLKGMFRLAQIAAGGMRAAGRAGSIINIASILGFRQAGGVASYAVAKAGVIQLTKVLALEWARHGIRVNAIAPGYIQTAINEPYFASDAGQAMIRRIPQRRLGRVEDLHGPLLLLASDASAYMTGSVIVVDGGHLTSAL